MIILSHSPPPTSSPFLSRHMVTVIAETYVLPLSLATFDIIILSSRVQQEGGGHMVNSTKNSLQLPHFSFPSPCSLSFQLFFCTSIQQLGFDEAFLCFSHVCAMYRVLSSWSLWLKYILPFFFVMFLHISLYLGSAIHPANFILTLFSVFASPNLGKTKEAVMVPNCYFTQSAEFK